MSMLFIPNPVGIAKIAHGKEMKDFVNGEAERVAARAREIAPVHTGDYRDSLHTTTAEETADSVRATVYSDDWKWGFVEFGTIHNPAHHVLERAVNDSGLEFRRT